MDLIRSISWMSASHLRLIRDDDSYIDRLSHRYTVAICIIFCIVVSTKQYAGDPIDCWVPAQFKASYEKYADSYCWIAGSWYTPMDKELPLDDKERKEHRIRYYQWVPFLLLFQAILCYIPRIVWRSLNVRSGLDLVNLIDAAIKYESVDKFTDREKIMSYIVKNVERYIGARKSRYERLYGRQGLQQGSSHLSEKQNANKNSYADVKNRLHNGSPGNCCTICMRRVRLVFSTVCFWTGKRLGNYLVVLYMFVKSLWVTNAFSQLFLLNRFIGNDYHAFGIEIIEMLLSGQEWQEMRHFPRVTYCDFKIREIGNSHDWTVQCVLRINLFNEVIYIFMWFWLCILAIFSILDFITWTIRLIVPSDKLRFIKRHLDIYNCYLPNENRSDKSDQHYSQQKSQNNRPDFEYVDVQKEKALMREFTFKYLKDDGIFAMRILSSSASDLIATEIISELWKNFRAGHDDSVDKVSLSSHDSNASGSTHDSSDLTSGASTPSPLNNNIVPQMNKQPMNHIQPPPSPRNYPKKTFNYNQSDRSQNSPFQSNQQQGQNYGNLNNSQRHNQQTLKQPQQYLSNSQNNFATTSNNNNNKNLNSDNSDFQKRSPSFEPSPPVPINNAPKLQFSKSEDPGSNNKRAEKTQRQEAQQKHSIHLTQEHSNVNPNSKDTHV